MIDWLGTSFMRERSDSLQTFGWSPNSQRNWSNCNQGHRLLIHASENNISSHGYNVMLRVHYEVLSMWILPPNPLRTNCFDAKNRSFVTFGLRVYAGHSEIRFPSRKIHDNSRFLDHPRIVLFCHASELVRDRENKIDILWPHSLPRRIFSRSCELFFKGKLLKNCFEVAKKLAISDIDGWQT